MEKEVRNGLWESYCNFRISAKTGWNEYNKCRKELVNVIRSSGDGRLISTCLSLEKSLISYDKKDYNFLKFLGMIEYQIGWTEEDEQKVAEVLKMKRKD